ncbi:TetR/AcrR family transcriptional regulator [Burkholderia metallica]|uniref:TetR/AcrR family transcriptional regulator n=1 Tax=Burkholderia metallica TaxID=488729 RepID=A0ABT8PDZ7_9BURK|nr:TetR/AcrR family transcriptional regulator [Burkholderia metallica]AOJ33874.1 TetR family transcriptional regulator [Burkholderia metallica]MCA8001826.1 TetR/AcrR family transcriptional regulator [Burkholderia metallica]MCA8017979.1 TetR/AcrR family transcriptional regulator [Burkholderia metallica]MDN7933328.1 TetR/AcrR family transcriptional regulator [Burkholderia metallica]
MRASKRQMVVDTATRLFSIHGFQSVGIERIISESGVARMTLYRHFAGKDDLIREVLVQRYALIFASVEPHIYAQDDPTDKVKAVFDWYGAWFRAPEFAGCLFERALAEFGRDHPNISEVAIRYRLDMTRLMACTLEGILPTAKAAWLSGIFMLLLDGATVEARASNNTQCATEAWHAAETLLMQYLPSSPPARKISQTGK